MDNENINIQDDERVLEKIENDRYIVKIYTIRNNNKIGDYIKSKVTPLSKEDISDLLYRQGYYNPDYFYFLLCDTHTKNLIDKAKIRINPRPLTEETNNLQGDYSQNMSNGDTFEAYRRGRADHLNEIERISKIFNTQNNNNSSFQERILKEQAEELKQLRKELLKEKESKNDSFDIGGTLSGVGNLLGNLMKTNSNTGKNIDTSNLTPLDKFNVED